MALNNAIRRAASRVVPLAIRASAGSQRYLHQYRRGGPALFAANSSPVKVLQGAFPSFHRHFSSKKESDASLLRVIESEIKCALESDAADADAHGVEEVPQGFPFKIEDHPGQQTVTLGRDYQDETITVEVHMPNLVTGEENDDDDDDDENQSDHQMSIPLVVRVSKKSGPSLEFGCTACPDEITIDNLAIKDPETSEEQIVYEGPDFADLDENLQKAFHKYLEIRGIKPSTTNFLVGYMLDKDNREYVTWLKNLQNFVQA